MDNNFFYKAYMNFNKLKKDFVNHDKNLSFNIGYYDHKNKIWYNGWAINASSNISPQYYSKSKELLKYALDIEKDMLSVDLYQRILIKSCLINSKYHVSDKVQLDMIVAIITYLTKATKFNVIKTNDISSFSIDI